MTSTTYQTLSSVPLAAVMVGVVVTIPMAYEFGQSIPDSNRPINPELSSFYTPGNAGMTIRVQTGITGDRVVDTYRPRTELGRRLLALRRAYVVGGGQLLEADALDDETTLRRGGIADA